MLIMSCIVTALVSVAVTWGVLVLPDWYARREFAKLGGPAVWIDPEPTTTHISVGGQTFSIPRK